MLALQRVCLLPLLLLSYLIPICKSTLPELNGRLIQCSREVYLVTTNTTPPIKRLIPDMDVFISWGLDTSEVARVSCEEIQRYELGENLPSRPKPPSLVNETEVKENMDMLKLKLDQVVGVYKDPDRAKQTVSQAIDVNAEAYGGVDAGSNSGSKFGSKVHSHHPEYADALKKTVIVTGCNRGFVNHLQNFKCFMDRLGFKFLVVSMDLATHEYLTEKTDMVSYYYKSKNAESMEEATTFRSRHFNMIVKRKKHAVYDIMKLGYNVLFSDTDVVLTRDPMAHMIWRNMDYVFSINHICPYDDQFNFQGCKPHKCLEGNTGFYFVRSNERTIKTWEHSFDAMEKNGKLDDQAIFWSVLRRSTDPAVNYFRNCSDLSPNDFSINEKLTICPLNLCKFNSGMLRGFWGGTYADLIVNLERRNEVMYALHANYVSGNENKAQALDKHGLWLATESSKGVWNGKCKDLVPENASYICELKQEEGALGQQCIQSPGSPGNTGPVGSIENTSPMGNIDTSSSR